MKKTLPKIIILIIFFFFVIPFILKVSASSEWYFTKINKILLGSYQPGAIEFMGGTTSLDDCNLKRNTVNVDSNYYTLGPCTEKISAPSGEGWGYSVDTKIAPVLANNPIGFKTEEDCNTNRDNYLKSDIHKNDTYFVSIGSCQYKKGITNNGVVDVAGQVNATGNSSVYTLLAPIGSIKTMNSSGCAEGDNTCIGNNIGKYLNFVFKFGIGLSAALAVIYLIIYGVTYMGDESIFGKTEAKSRMFKAVLGLIIALGAWALLNTINPDLTGTNFNIDTAKIEVVRNRVIDSSFIKNIESIDT